jgi:hypothetical protein
MDAVSVVQSHTHDGREIVPAVGAAEPEPADVITQFAADAPTPGKADIKAAGIVEQPMPDVVGTDGVIRHAAADGGINRDRVRDLEHAAQTQAAGVEIGIAADRKELHPKTRFGRAGHKPAYGGGGDAPDDRGGVFVLAAPAMMAVSKRSCGSGVCWAPTGCAMIPAARDSNRYRFPMS